MKNALKFLWILYCVRIVCKLIIDHSGVSVYELKQSHFSKLLLEKNEMKLIKEYLLYTLTNYKRIVFKIEFKTNI